MAPTVVFRCDGSAELGFGHLSRCLALADVFRREHNLESAFATRPDARALALVRARDFSVHASPLVCNDVSWWLAETVEDTGARVLVVDIREPLRFEAAARVRRHGVLIATIDDPTETRLMADLAFYPPIPQLRCWDWSGFAGRLFAGWEWVVLRPEFAVPPPSRPDNLRPVVLLTMGGSDPAGLTMKVLEALTPLSGAIDIVVLIGPGFAHGRALDRALARAGPRVSLRRDVNDVRALFWGVDLAVASFGVTAYELAAAGVPAVHLCLTEDHAESASAFAEVGIAVNLGVHTRVHARTIGQVVGALCGDAGRRQEMRRRARQLVDGRGASRAADVIVQVLSERAREAIQTRGRSLRT